MTPNLTNLLSGSGERHSLGSQYGGRYATTPAFQSRASQGLSDLWWMVSRSLPPVTADTIDISANQGRLYRPSMAYPDIYGHTPTLIPAQSYTVATTVKEDILDGDQLWIKIVWNADTPDTGEPPVPVRDYDGDGALRFRIVDLSETGIDTLSTSTEADHDHSPDGATPDGGHDHTITIASGTAIGDVTDVSVEYNNRGIVMQSASYEIYTTAEANALADDRENTYIHVATFGVSGTALSISQRIAGCPITVYPLLFVYGSGVGD